MVDSQGSMKHAIADATALPLKPSAVTGCIDAAARPSDATFQRALEGSLAGLHPAERRGALGGVTGHVAESVVEIALESVGWTPVWHFLGPGRHGLDLLLLGPGEERLFAVEVKGTLRPRRWPQLRRGEMRQMDLDWIDKSDNPAMTEWGVTSDDVYGGIVLVNFAELVYKVALTSDFTTWRPIDRLEQLETLDWLDAPWANQGGQF
jgi:hypothetical protein